MKFSILCNLSTLRPAGLECLIQRISRQLIATSVEFGNDKLPLLLHDMHELVHLIDITKDDKCLTFAAYVDRAYMIEHRLLCLIQQNCHKQSGVYCMYCKV